MILNDEPNMLLIKTIPDPLVYPVMTLTSIRFIHMSTSGSIILHIYLVTAHTRKKFLKIPTVNDSVIFLVQLMCLELFSCNEEQSYNSSSPQVRKTTSIQISAVMLAAKSPLIDT